MAAAQIAKTLLFNFIVDEVCYPPYGCFRRDGVFKDNILPLPESPTYLNSRFVYYNTENDTPLPIDIEEGTLPQLKRHTSTIIIVHGFLEDSTAFWLQDMVRAFLRNTDTNIIVVEWEKGARFPYNQAISNIRIVGAQLVHFIERLFAELEIMPSNIHLVGFSLGAHLVGLVGEDLRNRNRMIGRITGLDPAGPYFEEADTRLRLDPTDADFVDVIHTDSKLMVFGGLGCREPLGHADFYPNKGFSQPGCTGITETLFSKQKLLRGISCSHYRAAEYFTESIKDQNKFHSYLCSNADEFIEGKCHLRACERGYCNNMGYHAKKLPGKYFLNTNSQPPYAANHYLVKVKTGRTNFADSLAKLTFMFIGNSRNSRNITVSSRYLKSGSDRVYLIHTRENLLPLRQIKIGHSAVLWSDGWFLNKVTIISLDTKERYIGCSNTWLAESNVVITLKGPTQKKNRCRHPTSRVRTRISWLWG